MFVNIMDMSHLVVAILAVRICEKNHSHSLYKHGIIPHFPIMDQIKVVHEQDHSK